MSDDPRTDAIRFSGGALRLDLLYNPAGQQRGGVLALLMSSPFRGHPSARGAIRALLHQSFNTSPLLCGFALGPLFHAIKDASLEEKDGAEQARRTAVVLAPALAALGDRFVFSGTQPAVSALILMSAVVLPLELLPWVLGVWFVLHLVLQSYWRRRGWATGLEREGAVLSFLRGRKLEQWILAQQYLARFAAGAAIGGSVMFAAREANGASVFVVLGGFLAVALWARRRTAGRGRTGALLLWALILAWTVS